MLVLHRLRLTGVNAFALPLLTISEFGAAVQTSDGCRSSILSLDDDRLIELFNDYWLSTIVTVIQLMCRLDLTGWCHHRYGGQWGSPVCSVLILIRLFSSVTKKPLLSAGSELAASHDPSSQVSTVMGPRPDFRSTWTLSCTHTHQNSYWLILCRLTIFPQLIKVKNTRTCCAAEHQKQKVKQDAVDTGCRRLEVRF